MNERGPEHYDEEDDSTDIVEDWYDPRIDSFDDRAAKPPQTKRDDK